MGLLHRKLIRATAIGAFVVVLLQGCGTDPAPPDFYVGAERADDGTVRVSYVFCTGKPLTHLAVSTRREGEPSQRIWSITASDVVDKRGDSAVESVTIGSTPTGYIEDAPFKESLLGDGLIGVSLSTSDQPDADVAFFFAVSDLKPDKVWTEEAGAISADRFRERAAKACS